MSNNEGGLSCTQGVWLLALGVAIIASAMLMVLGGWRLIPGIFAFVVLTIIIGALLQWLVCKPMSAPGTALLRDQNETPTPGRKEPAAADAAAARADAEPAPPTPAAAPANAATAGVTPSKALSGEAELASRKGTWKYESGAAAPAGPGSAAATPSAVEPATAEPATADPAPEKPAPERPAPEKPAEPAAAAPVPDAKPPEQLTAAREGGPDDLKMIKGVGPKLEQMLHGMGFFHFDQIASWTDREVAWVDANLDGFKGRVSRDNWVEQARTLAGGGATEFSQKARKGDVY